MLALGALTATLLFGTGRAWATGVFLNGVRVNGLKNQRFDGCKVVFDARGNVYITVAGFKVRAIPQGSPPRALPPTIRTPVATPGVPSRGVPGASPDVPVIPRPVAPPPPVVARPRSRPAPVVKAPPRPIPASLSKRYFLVAMTPRPGYAQYDVDVYFNGQWVKKIRNQDRQVVVEVTGKLKPGPNKIHFAATKNMDGKPRLSTSSADFIRVILGAGNKGGGTVSITKNEAEIRVGANQTQNVAKETSVFLD